MINRHFLSLKIHLFCFYAALCAILPYLPPFGNAIGLNYKEIGVVFSILPFLGVVAKPLFGWLSDQFNMHRSLLVILVFVQALSTFLILYIPRLPVSQFSKFHLGCEPESVTIHVNETNYDLEMCPSSFHRPALCQLSDKNSQSFCRMFNISLNDPQCKANIDNAIDVMLVSKESSHPIYHLKSGNMTKMSCEDELNAIAGYCRARPCAYSEHDGIIWTSTFGLYLLLLIISRVAFVSAISIADALTFDLLGKFGDTSSSTNTYGYQRMFGTIGWMLMGPIIGFGLDYHKNTQVDASVYDPLFYIQFGLFLLAGFVACFFESSDNIKMQTTSASEVLLIFKNAEILLFVSATIVNGMATGALYVYFVMYMQELGAEYICIGVALLVETISETPIMGLSQNILQRVGSHGGMAVCLISIFIRYGAFAFISNPWMVLIVEPLHGVAFGLFYANMVSFANSIAPPGKSATLQGIIGGLYEGLGIGIGGLIAGYIYQDLGYSSMWAFFSLLCLGFTVVYVFLAYVLKKRNGFEAYHLTKKTELSLNGLEKADKEMKPNVPSLAQTEDLEDEVGGGEKLA